MRALLVGGSSEIGLAIVRRLAADGPVAAVLVGRDPDRLQAAADRLGREGVDPVAVVIADADDLAAHERAVADAFDNSDVDVVVLAVGVLGAQAGLDADPDEAEEVMRVNFVGAGSLLLHCTRRLRAQRRGTLIVLSSVAGELPRASNPIYGAAKAGLDALAQGIGDAAAGERRARARGAARLCQDPDDLRVEAGTVRDHRRSRRRGDRRGAARTGPHGLGTCALALDLCFAEAYAP